FAVASPEVVERIRARIMPDGRCARVSSLVEDAQCTVLFGECPGTSRREQSIKEQIRRNRLRIRRAVKSWIQLDENNRNFAGMDYDDDGFLDFYLIRYFSDNVLKIQQTLLTLLKHNVIP